MTEFDSQVTTYLVGGAVRDQLLGLTVKDRDYVVVGATPEAMAAQGFLPIGKDFPVFLHPETKDEYALARTERKSGVGYHGFIFNTDTTVTLEDDLLRRDLTINAIAQDQQGKLIDPYGGVEDLKNGLLKHVSPAFAEDPVRVLRVARFMSRFADLGFKIHSETQALMRQLVDAGEIENLVPERVWQEIKNSLNQAKPSAFFLTLRECGALVKLLPEIDCLFGIPQTKRWHPEIDTGLHAMLAIDQAKDLDNDVAYAVMVHDLGKGITPEDVLPSHRGHEAAGLPLVEAVSERLKVPNHYKKLALLVCRWHLHAHTIMELKAASIEKLFTRLQAYRQPQLLEKFVLACEADATGRWGEEFQQYPQADFIRQLFQAAYHVDKKPLFERGYEGEALGQQIRQLRISAIQSKKKELMENL
ncbi:multifunctional CCA addition/repair protein [Marinicella sp. S1101]|uniref:multifunctional CCA addition/repair protein n=1 Tax=Marinicella marina TaxID=2996016 RepID=UPI002260E606|nr:multifunctional CCA addition/repair protein [Marinicella marina]MCX7553348.1 multifunctional CCA addition/repair protein [Marinicella marina]MDJ1139080.1 multifunctional CCA addition/repair protein [Marinicella marina]